ncbi:MAG: hypothetical protein HY749_00600 [Gammaproteobacteria bacterium]|nr:hypothetical protein [Gammaproteobacteria bacterium]
MTRAATPAVPRLIPGKLTAPQRAGDALRRTRLVAAILESSEPLVAIVAPAGFGKTTLMVELYAAELLAGRPASWLTLDARDDDPGRFVAYLRAFAERITALPAAVAGPDPFSAAGAGAAALLDAIASAGPCTLFLDDVEKITAPEVLRLVQEMIDAVQDGQRIVVGARGLGRLALSTQQLRGRVRQLDAAALRFDADETRAFLAAQPALGLDAAATAQLHERTEGWPAAVRLAALALPGQRDPARWIAELSGHSAGIATYLAENVLHGLDPHVAQFLVRSSVLEQLSGELCDAVLDTTDSATLLAGLARANAFIVAFGPPAARPAYRFLALFRDFLQAELARTAPSEVPALHRRAAQWYRERQRFPPAIDHALAAGEFALAADLMAECALDFVAAGRIETVAGWLDALPGALAGTRPALQRARAYAMIALHRYAAAEDALAHCRRDRGAELEATILAALLHEFMDRHDLTRREIADYAPQLDRGRTMLDGIARNIMAYHAIARGAGDEAALLLAAAKSASAGGWANTYSVCFEAALDLSRADPRAALARLDAAVSGGVGAGLAAVYRALALYELDDDVGAASLLEEHLQAIRAAADLDTVILACRCAARAAFLAGAGERVERLLATLGDLGDVRGVPRPRAAAWLESARFALLRGDVEAARRYVELGAEPRLWAAHAGFELPAHDLDGPAEARLRLDVVAGDAERALAALPALIERADAQGRRRRKFFLQGLQAQAQAAAGQRPAALRTLEQTLRAAAPSGVLRAFADEPWSLAGLLDELARSGRGEPAQLARLGHAVAKLDARRGAVPLAPAGRGLLSPRETAILRLVADGRANKEIARLLGITDNTVETHLRRVNQKLDTHTRTQAIARARQLDLL